MGYECVGVKFRLVRVAVTILVTAFILSVALLPAACRPAENRRSIPPEVEATISAVSKNIEQERYENLYDEASDLWRQDSTLAQSTEVFKTLKAKLGKVENRKLHNAIEQSNSGGPLKGRAFIITYQTRFERGEGMESFTLVEREGRWLLARYFVNSTALQ